MFLFLFVLFIVIPIIEISVIIKVGSYLGVMMTLTLMILSAALGASLVRSQGVLTLMNLRQRLQQGQLPQQEIAEGVLLAVAGVLLITPGFITDILGLSFLFPVSRAWIVQQVIDAVKTRGVSSFMRTESKFSRYTQDSTSSDTSKGRTIDGEFTRRDL